MKRCALAPHTVCQNGKATSSVRATRVSIGGAAITRYRKPPPAGDGLAHETVGMNAAHSVPSVAICTGSGVTCRALMPRRARCACYATDWRNMPEASPPAG
jgi:hypothetical protein